MIRTFCKKVASWKVACGALLVSFLFVLSNSAVASLSCPTSTPVETLWTVNDAPTTPSASDTHSADLGVRFQSDTAGQILGVKFYKGAGNTGTHVGYLWASNGSLLSSVTFTNETATGWQEALFASPVNITANTAYVVSYLAPVGHYSYTHSYFTSAHASGDLTAPKDAVGTSNGVYTYTPGAYPNSSYLSTNYWVDVEFTAAEVNPSPSPSITSTSPSPSASASSSPSSSPSSSASDSPSASSTGSPTTTPPSTGYVMPGTVGYLGDTNALTVYQPGGAAPSGCSWLSYGLRCDQTSVTWDHVWIKGGVYWTGTGVMKVTNSIIQGGSGTEWYALLGHPSSSGSLPGSEIEVLDSTLGWLPGHTEPSGQDVAPVWSLYGNQPLDLERDDLSGMPQGTDPGEGSLIKDNWIHNLNQNGTSSAPSHIDGIYSQGGGNILIEGNYVDVPVRSDTTASLFIQDRGSTDTGISLINNYFNGGAYVLRNQTGIAVNVEGNVLGNSLYGTVGDLSGYPGTYGTWSNNVDINGNPISKP